MPLFFEEHWVGEAVAPALFVRRLVTWPVALICWLAFVAATLLWFYGAMISLMVFLS
ncbi:MAG: hypothetical protein ACYC3X_05035 [Pirellulaceae bacterium]